jgi:hypothetical protein
MVLNLTCCLLVDNSAWCNGAMMQKCIFAVSRSLHLHPLQSSSAHTLPHSEPAHDRSGLIVGSSSVSPPSVPVSVPHSLAPSSYALEVCDVFDVCEARLVVEAAAATAAGDVPYTELPWG